MGLALPGAALLAEAMRSHQAAATEAVASVTSASDPQRFQMPAKACQPRAGTLHSIENTASDA
ncbi:hypothetical protein B7L66_18320 [Xanthomonas citri pv. citri]|nr:hypothetical protein B7L66_18320 [Xanthomonas citri pv. citri]EWC49742.1 hypothetical protein XAR_4014 [Xanthomonas citri pv. glycines str. 8ra]OOX22736.1 hypothetical protein Xazr_03455 [Xanthomonas campestris pv. azadirachtae]CCF67933.1 hypothetical protein XAPC_1629 [Xanthomonas citri pv. punicae str. LMG 859]